MLANNTLSTVPEPCLTCWAALHAIVNAVVRRSHGRYVDARGGWVGVRLVVWQIHWLIDDAICGRVCRNVVSWRSY